MEVTNKRQTLDTEPDAVEANLNAGLLEDEKCVKRRRGRPPGSKNTKKQIVSPITDSVEEVLQGV